LGVFLEPARKLAQALFQTDSGLKAEIPAHSRCVGQRCPHLAGGLRLKLDLAAALHFSGEHADEFQQFRILIRTNVVKRGRGAPGRRPALQYGQRCLHGIVDIGERPPLATVAEHLQRPTGKQVVGKGHRRHVRPPPGAVHRKVAHPGTGKAMNARIGIGQQLARALGGGINAPRTVGGVLFGKRHLFRVAVNRRGRGVEQMLHAMARAALQQHGQPGDIAR